MEVVRVLVSAGADKDKARNDGTTLYVAALKGHVEVVSALYTGDKDKAVIMMVLIPCI